MDKNRTIVVMHTHTRNKRTGSRTDPDAATTHGQDGKLSTEFFSQLSAVFYVRAREIRENFSATNPPTYIYSQKHRQRRRQGNRNAFCAAYAIAPILQRKYYYLSPLYTVRHKIRMYTIHTSYYEVPIDDKMLKRT